MLCHCPKWEENLVLIFNGLKCACLVIAQNEKKNLCNPPRVFLFILLSHTPCVQFVWHVAYAMYALTRQNFNALVNIYFTAISMSTDLLNQKFLVRVDCKSAKHVLQKDVQNIASKQIFARWQAILSIFYFDIEYIKGSRNSIPDFLTREFLQGKNVKTA